VPHDRRPPDRELQHDHEEHQDARRRALVGGLASASRWRYLERRAHAAYQRHTRRAEQSLSAVVR
jgi:hypothetical protein